MMSGPRVDWRQRRRWALETLEIEPRDAKEIRAALFDRLAHDDYAPATVGLEAADFLVRPANVSEHAAAEFERRHEERLLRKVAQLAQHWFQLNPDDRRRRWNRLAAAAIGYPLAHTWLQHLERGLDLPQHVPGAPPPVRYVLQSLGRLFVVPPRERRRLRHECRRHLAPLDSETVRGVVVTVQRDHPQWAALDQRLLKSLARRPSDPLPAPHRSWWQPFAPFAWGAVAVAAFLLRMVASPGPRGQDHIPKFQPPPQMTMPTMSLKTLITPEIRALLARESTLSSDDCLRIVHSFVRPSSLHDPEIARAATLGTLTLQGVPQSERDAVDRIFRRVIREGLLNPAPPRPAEPFSAEPETPAKSGDGSVPALRIEPDDDPPLFDKKSEPVRSSGE